MSFNVGEIINIDAPLMRLERKHPGFEGAIKIGKRDFKSYLTYRFIKDSISFVPIKDVNESLTDASTMIHAPIPKNEEDFLGYIHELGHCKAKQYRSSRQSYMGMYMSVDKACVENEVNAWHWGLRYYRRLGMKLSEQGRKLICKTLGSYLKIASDKDHAKACCERIKNLTGLSYEDYVPREQAKVTSSFTITVDWTNLKPWTDYCPTKKEVVKTVDKRKPWVILNEKKQKRQWRNQR